jgi:hypothetical protein
MRPPMLRAGRDRDILIFRYYNVIIRQYYMFTCQCRGAAGDSSFLRKSVLCESLIAYSPGECCYSIEMHATLILWLDKGEILQWHVMICTLRCVVRAVIQTLHPTLHTLRTHLQVVKLIPQKSFSRVMRAWPGSRSAQIVDRISQGIFRIDARHWCNCTVLSCSL